ncbi:Glycosyl transferase, family 14 [Sesbania bispinosa]|nr:Glycosyl transferase, family 14 [Sesbania bispinosa]
MPNNISLAMKSMSQSDLHPDKSQNELESEKLQVQFDSGMKPEVSSISHVRFKEFHEPSHVMHDMNDEELLWRASVTPKIHEYPFDRVPKMAFMFLVRGSMPLAPLWEKFFKGHKGYYSIYLHSNPSYNELEPESPLFHGRRIPIKVSSIFFNYLHLH